MNIVTPGRPRQMALRLAELRPIDPLELDILTAPTGRDPSLAFSPASSPLNEERWALMEGDPATEADGAATQAPEEARAENTAEATTKPAGKTAGATHTEAHSAGDPRMGRPRPHRSANPTGFPGPADLACSAGLTRSANFIHHTGPAGPIGPASVRGDPPTIGHHAADPLAARAHGLRYSSTAIHREIADVPCLPSHASPESPAIRVGGRHTRQDRAEAPHTPARSRGLGMPDTSG